MKNKILAVILLVTIAVVGCGKVDEKTASNTSDKKEELKVEKEIVDEIDTVSCEEDKGTNEESTGEVVEESTAETVPAEQIQPEEVQKTDTQKTESKKTQTKTETPVVTTPVVSAPVTATPEPEVKAKNCEHWYQPVETEKYTAINKMVWGCNGCGFPLFTIDPGTHDAVNIPDLYFHRECYSEKLGMLCPKPCGWHSEGYMQGWCYCCHSEIQVRTCTYFYVMAETCITNAGDLGEYEKVEPGYAYIKSCDCGQNILMTDAETGMGLMVKKEVCSYCGDTKTYPEK